MIEKPPVANDVEAFPGTADASCEETNRRTTSSDCAGGVERMLHAKLWDNPCWLAFRLNYLALRYNTPLYDWIQRAYGLSRAEYVVIYSLALTDAGQARDISQTSGFPKNTLSRAIARLEELGLIVRDHLPGGGRNQPLHLSDKGRQLFEDTLPAFERFERMMLSALTDTEQQTLADLLAKIVGAGSDWPRTILNPERDLPDADDSSERRP